MLTLVNRICLVLSVACMAAPSLGQSIDTQNGVAFELGEVDSIAFESAATGCECGDTIGCGTGCDAGDGWLGSTLLGDCRSHLEQSGIVFAGKVTHFAFGLDGGINTAVAPPFIQGDIFKYTGRGEYDFVVDLEKFGGLPHGKFLITAEHWWGEFGNVSLGSGSLTPPVFPAFLPVNGNDPGVPVITNFAFTQPLSENLIVFAGKRDVLGDVDQDVFAGGDGTDQFVSQALIANPAFLVAMPYTSFTFGAVMRREWGAIAGFVRDPQDRTQDFFRLEDLFSRGVLVGGEVKMKTNFFSKPGEHHVGGIWKHVGLPDLSFSASSLGDYPYELEQSGVPLLKDSYTIYYGFDQYLKIYSSERRRGWGVFGRASVSDGNPTPFEYFLSAGIGGDSPLRQGDGFGVGWYYNGVTSELGPGPEALFGPQHGNGVELFYNLQLTRCINITSDVQYVKPGFGAFTSGDNAFVYGLRINTRF